MNKVTFLLGISVAASLVACSGTYRVVKKTSAGGVIALQPPMDTAREKANGYMASMCPSGFDIVEEGEAVIGTSTQSSETSRPVNTWTGPGVRSSGSSETVEKKEWRITYQCKGAAPAPAVAPPTTPAAPAAGGTPTTSKLHTIYISM